MTCNNRGQTLIELVLALGLILVVVVAITTTNINGLRNSQFSQNQLQATKFAQEAIDLVRSIRNQNGSVCNGASAFNTITDFKGLLGLSACATACNFILKTASSPSGYCVSPTSTYWLNYTTSSTPDPLPVVNGLIFKRQIQILDKAASQKEITVTISWTDTTGTHQSQLSTVLTN